MDKKIAGLIGAAAALATVTAAHAAVPAQAAAPATTYRDLLDPVQNAVAVLKADDARQAAERSGDAVQLAQYHHHHHHHHRHFVPPPLRFFHRRHHHHHHHHHYYR